MPHHTTERNHARAESALRALLPYPHFGDNGTEECITDLLSDLRHLCAREGLQFDYLNARAANHFTEETGD